MTTTPTVAQEAAEDVFFGQIVIIWARWFFIAAAALHVLWSSTTTTELTFGILLVAALMAVNFFVHGRYLVEKPANRTLLVATSVVDLLLITLVVLTWQGEGGLKSHFFIFYYPLFFAFALVFPPRFTAIYTAFALSCYGLASLYADPLLLGNAADLKQITMRIITLAAMSALGTYYYRLQRAQRRARPDPRRRAANQRRKSLTRLTTLPE